MFHLNENDVENDVEKNPFQSSSRYLYCYWLNKISSWPLQIILPYFIFSASLAIRTGFFSCYPMQNL